MTPLVTVGASVLELSPPPRARLETADRLELAVTGPESNASVAASRLGTEAVWASKLPDGPLGRRVVGELRRHGVEPRVVWDATGRQGLAFTEAGRDPRPGTVIHDRTAAVATMTPDELPIAGVEASMAYVSAATATLSGTLAETTRTVFETIEGTAVFGLSRPRVLDSPAACETVESLLPAVDVLVTTAAGAARLADRATPTELVHALGSAHDFETVVLARESDGLVWHDATVHERRAPETTVIDDRGAFDAFCGGFLARRLDGAAPDRALATGVACGALARTTGGAVATFTGSEVEDRVAAMEGADANPPPDDTDTP